MINFLYICLPISFVSNVVAVTIRERELFVTDFIRHVGRPMSIMSFIPMQSYDRLNFYKALLHDGHTVLDSNLNNSVDINDNHFNVYLADLHSDNVRWLLKEAETKNILRNPAKWILFYDSNESEDCVDLKNNIVEDGKVILTSKTKQMLENIVGEVYVAMNTEVFVALKYTSGFHVFLIHRLRPHLPLQWEDYNTWHEDLGFTRSPPELVLSMRRLNQQGIDITASAVILDNRSIVDMPDFLYREKDTPTKATYYFMIHVFEWLNATGHIKAKDSWGYLQPNGNFSGVVGDIAEGISEFSGTGFIPIKNRMDFVEYVVPLNPGFLEFIFMKPSLATLSNIYIMPFSQGVWYSLLVLVGAASAALFLASFREATLELKHKTSVWQQLTQSFHDVFSLVLQQGTDVTPSSVSCRQILILNLMTFMFLYNAYSANVVALLQSRSNMISSIEALLNSPLQIGSLDTVYNRQFFERETRPVHQDLWLKKGLPQGENFFLSLEEGIQRIRNGLYAFHLDITPAYELIKRTFLEHEKCSLGSLTYVPVVNPHFGIKKHSIMKEQLRIGAIRLVENGVQTRSVRRVFTRNLQCDSHVAIFTAVGLLDVAPAFKCLLILYAFSVFVLAVELCVWRQGKRKQSLEKMDTMDAVDHNKF